MNFNLLVKYLDGSEKECAGKAADIVAFESKYDLSIAALDKDLRLTHLFFMAWHVEKRTGETKLDFEKWLETVESVEAALPKESKG